MVMASCSELSAPLTSKVPTQTLRLESMLRELPLYDFQIDSSHSGKEIAETFEANPLIPGVILIEQNNFTGMISRRRFLEVMSRPYGLELFLKRPLKCLHDFTTTDILKLPGNTLIVVAARQSLQRPAELLYEPIVVELENGVYKLVDVHQLLVAQSQIHELTTKLLDEETQAKMLQTEKMASLGQMVAGVAHEIRNPVNCINGNLTFLSNYYQSLIKLLSIYEKETFQNSQIIKEVKEDIEIDYILSDLPKVLETMNVATEQLIKIVGGMQNFSRMDDAKRQSIDIHECIESTLLILNSRLKHHIKVIKNYGDLPLVSCYSGQLSQVFMNIISNAIDALMDQPSESENWQPKIEITTEVLAVEGRDWLAVRIADNGPGIPQEIQARIFETFFTTKPIGQGTGLGLAITHQIVTQKHGGQLLVRSHNTSSSESHSDYGTEFEIRLPLV